MCLCHRRPCYHPSSKLKQPVQQPARARCRTILRIGPRAFQCNAVLASIDEKFRFTETRNAEVKFRWLSLCLQCGSLFIVPHVVAFLTQQGRMKFVRPLFRMLHKADSKIASSTFANNLNFYHPIARKLIESDIKGWWCDSTSIADWNCWWTWPTQ